MTGSAARPEVLHATCVAHGARGIVITGPSGSGKSDLALRLILGHQTPGFSLVADDLVRITAEDGAPKALAPVRHAGLIEVRGMGLVRVPHAGSVSIVLAVALRPWRDIERYPQPLRKEMNIAGLSVPVIEIDANSPSSALRVGLALALLGEPDLLYGSRL